MKKTILGIFYLSILFIIVSACASNNKNNPNNTNDSIHSVKISDNLIEAIKQEKIAIAQYEAYANKAKEEGLTQIEILFKAISEATLIHVSNLTKALEKMNGKIVELKPVFNINSTKENIEETINKEKIKISTSYPQYIKLADSEGTEDASIALYWANETKKKFIDMLNNALTAIKNNNINKLSTVYYICPKCGNIYDATSVEEDCSFCGTGKSKFVIIK